MINILQRVFFYVRMFLLPHIVVFALALLTGVAVSAASGLGIPVMVKYIFPVVFYTPGSGEELPKLFEHIPALETLHQENPMLVLLMACAALPLMFLLRGFTMWLNGLVVSILGVNISATVRKTVFDKLQAHPISFLENHEKGDLISRTMADTGTVQIVLTRVANDLFKQPITCVVAIATFLWMMLDSGQSVLFLLNTVLIALAFWPIILFGKRITQKARHALTDLGKLNAVVQQNLETMREVRAYSMEERQILEFSQVAQDYCRNSLKLVKYQRALVPIMEIITAVALAALLVRGRECGMSLADFLAVSAALFFLFDSMKKAGSTFNRLNETQGALIRIEEILTAPNTMPEPEHPLPLPEPPQGDIEFRNVSFSYESGRPALKNISVHIPAGQIVGLVGVSGAGKTTFAALISRFYDVDDGAVLVDGVDVRDVLTHDLRSRIALVGQQALLFSGSIRENISLGRPGASESSITAAATAAAVTPFLGTLAHGLDTQVGEGGCSLSGGQRQRVAIARAFLKDAPILILDEATASLDAESERDIQRELDRISVGRTTLIVAHRFSTLRRAERILLFDHGSIIADGSHEQLYASSPLYRELYDRQGIEEG